MYCCVVVDVVGLLVMFYDVLYWIGMMMVPQMLRVLVVYLDVLVLKDVRGDLVVVEWFVVSIVFVWYCGVDDFVLFYLVLGAVGVVSVVGNVVLAFVWVLVDDVWVGDFVVVWEFSVWFYLLVDVVFWDV